MAAMRLPVTVHLGETECEIGTVDLPFISEKITPKYLAVRLDAPELRRRLADLFRATADTLEAEEEQADVHLTPDQEEADTRLRVAIEHAAKAFGSIPDDALITDYVITGVSVTLTGDPGNVTMFALPTGGTMPHYKVLGLLRQAQVFYESDI